MRINIFLLIYVLIAVTTNTNSNVAMVEKTKKRLSACYQYITPDIEFPLIEKQRLLYVLLNNRLLVVNGEVRP